MKTPDSSDASDLTAADHANTVREALNIGPLPDNQSDRGKLDAGHDALDALQAQAEAPITVRLNHCRGLLEAAEADHYRLQEELSRYQGIATDAEAELATATTTMELAIRKLEAAENYAGYGEIMEELTRRAEAAEFLATEREQTSNGYARALLSMTQKKQAAEDERDGLADTLRHIAEANPAADPLTAKWWENIRAIARAALAGEDT